jgi:parallel beta-helix repeat protein/predicted outer membrane repeat protein
MDLLRAGGVAALGLALAATAFAEIRYVWTNSPSPASPYTNWDTAARDIQSAINAAASGDTVLVTNGVYNTGGVAMAGAMTNRIAITQALTVRSVSGPAETVIAGQASPSNGACGDGAVRCAWMADGAVLIGFTLTGGHTRVAGDVVGEQSGGGVWSAYSVGAGFVSNCTLAGNSAFDHGGGALWCTLRNCTLIGNCCSNEGGGAYGSLLRDCTVAGNLAFNGGGTYEGTLTRCTVTGNVAQQWGGGSHLCTLSNCTVAANGAKYGAGAHASDLYHCTVTGNVAESGGGSYQSWLYDCLVAGNRAYNDGGGAVLSYCLSNCTVTGNTASNRGGGLMQCYWAERSTVASNSLSSAGAYGGGTYGSTLYSCTVISNAAPGGSGGGAAFDDLTNCVVTGNSCAQYGGGAIYATLNNCTVAGNTAGVRCGGASGSLLTNCIVYNNTGGTASNHYSCTAVYTCSAPLPSPGPGNIADAPSFVDAAAGNYRLKAGSPCINAGLNPDRLNGATDRDGNPRVIGGVVDMGAYESTNGVTTNGVAWGWLMDHGWATDGSADWLDPDSDRFCNWREYSAGTDPINPASFLWIISISNTVPPATAGIVVCWSSVTGKVYSLDRATNLVSPAPFDSCVRSNVPATAPINAEADTNAPGDGPCFYRIRVE